MLFVNKGIMNSIILYVKVIIMNWTKIIILYPLEASYILKNSTLSPIAALGRFSAYDEKISESNKSNPIKNRIYK